VVWLKAWLHNCLLEGTIEGEGWTLSSDSDEGSLKEVFKQAADLVKDVPADLRAAAFQRAVDELLGGGRRAPSKRRKKLSGRKRKTTGAGSDEKKEKKKRASRRLGPKAVLEELISEDFFKTPKSLGEALDHIRKSKAYQFRPNELSPALVRLVREKKLTRDRTESGQYEYSVA
jgi:hypothetical protein